MSDSQQRMQARSVSLVLPVCLVMALTGMRTAAGRTGDRACEITISGSNAAGRIARQLADSLARKQPDVKVTLLAANDAKSANSLIAGKCHIAAMARCMSVGELKAALDRKVVPVPHVLAMDGIAVVVNRSNPVGGLVLEQVRDIYAGKLANWKEVGGRDAAIYLISPDGSSSEYEAFKALAMNGRKMTKPSEVVGPCCSPCYRVAAVENSISFVKLASVSRRVKLLEINGFTPAFGSVRTGKYPLARPLFMLTRGYPRPGSPLFHLVTMPLTKDGHQIIMRLGCVPLTEY